MPIAITPNFESNILESIKDYLVTNVVTPYNTFLPTTPLGIELEKPVDPTVKPVMPLLLIFRPVTNAPYRSTGNGDGTGWIYKSYRIGCFPALTIANKPDPVAEFYLRSYMEGALETALYLPISDHTVTPAVMIESAQVADARIVMPIGKPELTMDIERFRFDAVFTLAIPVVSSHG